MKKTTPIVTITQRASEQTQISISISKELLDRVDEAAKAENRNRSNFISTELEKILGSGDVDIQGKKKKKKKDRFFA